MQPAALLLGLACAALAAGCDGGAEPKKAGGEPQATLVTVTRAVSTTLEVTQDTLGSLEAVMDPKVAAEVPGRVLRTHARTGKSVKKGELLAEIDATDVLIQARADEAEVKRLEALLAQAERNLARQSELVARNFISRNALDDVSAQRTALREQLAAARARAEAGQRAVAKTRVLSPLDGAVEVQIAAVGDYVKVGDPLFQLVSNQRLRAHLPYPETVAARLAPGLAVRISSPQTGSRSIAGVVSDIRPNIGGGSRAVDVIVDIPNDGSLRGGGTVNASVVIASRQNVVMVPEQSVVLRPAGSVVYVVAGEQAAQRVVRTGVRKAGMIEILAGLEAGETVALDGAGFLSDGAKVAVAEAGAR